MKNPLEIAAEIGPGLTQYVEEEENNRRPSRPVLAALRDAGLLKLFMPKSLGGFECDPLTTAKVVEEIGRYNTGAAWTMMVGNTATWWCSRLPEKGVEDIYKNGSDTFIAGTFHPPMKAIHVKGGYQVNGRCPLASNVSEAKWIFLTAMVFENEKPRLSNGQPEVIAAFINARDCEIIDTWHVFGMRATDSNDIAAKDVFVPEHHSYPLVPGFESGGHYRRPLYNFPAIGISVTCLIAPIALAIARNAIRELRTLAETKVAFGSTVPMKEKASIQRKIGMAEAMADSADAYLQKTIYDAWKKTLSGETISMEQRAGLLLASTHINQTCCQAVDLMYSAAGTSAIYFRNKLAHYFTDAQVIRQHGFANESRYETSAQALLGLTPDLPVLGL